MKLDGFKRRVLVAQEHMADLIPQQNSLLRGGYSCTRVR
jgi:hypothetical protein